MSNYRVLGQLAGLVGLGVVFYGCAVGEIDGTGLDGFDPGTDPNTSAQALQCPGAKPDVVARNGWRSSEATAPADGVLRLELKARPTDANLGGLVAVGAETVDDIDKAAIAVRFADNGLVDVGDGAFYASDMAYPYEPGVWYSIGILADIDNETYDVEIGPCGEPSETLIKHASFRDSAVVRGQLRTWAAWSSRRAALEVSTPAWMPSGGCVPATCASLGQECGQPNDGCGGTLDCGGCGNTELCDSGLCVEELVTTPAPPACVPDTCGVLGIECGVRSDGCGDYIACGNCESGYSCNSGVCVQTSSPPPVCEPDTCDSLSRECGVASDGCGGSLSCGGCQSGYSCSGGICVLNPVSPPPAGGDAERPWAHNTGPTDPGALVPSGSRTVTSDGAVLENLDVSGKVTIDADNVTLRNFRIHGSTTVGIEILNGHRGIVIEDGEIYDVGTGIKGVGYTGRRLYIHDCQNDGTKAQGTGGPTLVEYCFIEKLGMESGAHADGNQTIGGSNVTFRYNNIWMPAPGTPNYPGSPYKSNATFHYDNSETNKNMVVEYNWLNGGNYTIYCQESGTGSSVYVRHNLFGRDNKFGIRYPSRVCTEWTNNRYEDTGALIP
jgi:hypothetical protein